MPRKLQCDKCSSIFSDIETHDFDCVIDDEFTIVIRVPTKVDTYCSLGKTESGYICRRCVLRTIKKGK